MSEIFPSKVCSRPASWKKQGMIPAQSVDNPTMGKIISRRFSRRGFLRGSLAVSAIAAAGQPARPDERR